MTNKNLFSIVLALVILYLSLENMQKFEKISAFVFNIPYIDKIVHLGIYFVFMSVIIFENRNKIKTAGHLFLIALIPFLYGILMEILQSTLTTNRSGSIYDVIFNSAGILSSLLLWQLIKSLITDRVR